MNQTLSQHLLTMLSQGASIQELMDYAGKLYHGKLTALLSTSSKLLAFASLENVKNQQIREQVEQGFLNESTYNICRNEKLLERLHSETHSFLSKDIQNEGIVWLMASVRIQNIPVAYFVVSGKQNSFSKEELEWSDLFCQAFSIAISSNPSLARGVVRTETLLINDLLNGPVQEETKIISKMKMIGLPIYQEMCVLLLKWKNASDKKSSIALKSIIDTIVSNYYKKIIFTTYENGIILLLNQQELTNVRGRTILEELCEVLNDAGFHIGLSNPFQKITSIRRFYQQALDALTYGQQYAPEQMLYQYSDYSIYHLLQTTSMEHKDLCHPVLYRMYYHGTVFEKEEVETLFLYLNNMKDAKTVSQQLHIHRNTLFHRIRRILDVTGLSLDNGDDVFQIMLTNKILHM